MAKSLFETLVATLDNIPMHAIQNAGKPAGYKDPEGVTRYNAIDPLYTSVHVIAGGPGALVFEIGLGDEVREVESPATVYIPAGVPHSANVLRGSGAFVVLRLEPEQVNQTIEG